MLDEMGDRVRRTDPEGRVSEWSYDLRRRPATELRKMAVSDPSDDETEVSCYDGNGNRVARYLPAAVAALALSGSVELCASLPPGGWNYGFDGANRLVSVTDPLGNETTYGYDGLGNRTSQTDANLHTTSFEHDALERLTKKLYPEISGFRAEESYLYDENGNRTGLVDPEGRSFAWTFDELDRETRASYPLPAAPRGDDLIAIDTAYDENANPLAIVETRTGPPGEEIRTTRSTWDAFDRLLTRTDPWGKRLTSGYDPAGNRTRLTDPDGRTTLYGYDALDRLTAATLPDGGGVSTYEYFRNGLLKKVAYPNGASASHTYDLANRIERIENRQFTATSSSYEYAYDSNGNRARQIEQNGGSPETTTYAYDAADRLTRVSYPEKTVDYTLDGVGNRLGERTVDTAASTTTSDKTLVYNERDWLTSITVSANAANNATYAYDLNGNQVERTQGGVTAGFIYDTRDQLVEVQNDGSLVETYDYSYDGLRTRKSGSGSLFRYVYDGRSLLLETDLGGNTISKYEWGSDRLLSLNHSAEGRSFYLFDALGSPVSLSKPDGTLRARYLWDAWGNLRSTVGDSESVFGFTGYQRDEVTGLYYAGARFYQPEIGRFLNEDPFRGEAMTPPSLHRYLYAHQNPTVWVDPSGRTAALVAAATRMEQVASEAMESVDENSTTAETMKTGVTAGLLRVGAGATRAFNWVVNRVALNVSLLEGTKVEQEAQAERTQTLEKIRHAVSIGVQRLEEDPVGTTRGVLEAPDRLALAGMNATLRAASGDRQAQANLIASGVELGAAVIPLGTAGRARNAERLLEFAEDLAPGAEAARLASRSAAGASLDAGIQWGKGNRAQGLPWENFLERRYPAGARLPDNFKTFDFFSPDSGFATSAKTINTGTPSRIEDPRKVYYSFKSHIDAAAAFNKTYRLEGVQLDPALIRNRELQVAIPSRTTPEQWAEINRAVEYGLGKGVHVVVTETK